mmetsp:Transcript_63812/g.157003  ORF Transcript_63812/g.157003 Transcript_63812/m.157003 type:complete len:889 (+) Transcript_63812:198-2864(+)
MPAYAAAPDIPDSELASLDKALTEPKRLLSGQIDEETAAYNLEKTLSNKQLRKQASTGTMKMEDMGRQQSMSKMLGRQGTGGSIRANSSLDIHGNRHGDLSSLGDRGSALGRNGLVADGAADHHHVKAKPQPTMKSVRQWISQKVVGGFASNSPDSGNNDVKSAIEVLLEAKVNQFRFAVKKFRGDMAGLVVYVVFVAFFTASIMGRVQNNEIFNVRQAVENTIVSVGAFPGPVGQGSVDVGGVTDILPYLDQVIIPNVAISNMTALDPRCSFQGTDLDPTCDPTLDQCCMTTQPHPSAFVTGGNIMVTRLKIRQLSVQQEIVTDYAGNTIETYPTPWTPQETESRDGGGTTIQWDPRGKYIDWPSDQEWFSYQTCQPSILNKCVVADSRARYPEQYGPNGFSAVFEGTVEQMRQKLAVLNKYNFLDQRTTRAVFVDFTAYLSNRRLFVIVTLLFEVTDMGVVTPSHTIHITDLHQATALVWDILDYSVFGYAMMLMIVDTVKIWLQGRSYFSNGWNLISWINYALFIASLILRVSLDIQYSQIPNLQPMSTEAEAFPWQNVAGDAELIDFMFAFNALLTWLRVLSHLEAISPRTRQLTLTITRSGSDLASLVVLFFVVVVGFSLGFHLAFGKLVRDHRDLTSSLGALFQAILGQFDYEVLKGVNKIMAPLLFISYMVIVFFLILNMFLAVVMKTYDQVQEELASQENKQVTGTGLLKRQINLLIRLLKASDMDEVMGDMRKRRQGFEGDDWETKEELTYQDLEGLFKEDPSILERMSVKTYKELIRLADTEGRHFLPMNEVREIMDAKKAQMKSQRDHAAVHATVDPAEIQVVVDKSLKKEMEQHTKEMKAFIQNEVSNIGLVLSGTINGGAGEVPEPPKDKKPWKT